MEGDKATWQACRRGRLAAGIYLTEIEEKLGRSRSALNRQITGVLRGFGALYSGISSSELEHFKLFDVRYMKLSK